MTTMNIFESKYNEIIKTFLTYSLEADSIENVVASPLSIIVLLCMLAAATNGSTREEILSVISNGENYDATVALVKSITDKISESSLKSANAVCIDNSIKNTINDSYTKSLEKDFSGKLFASSNMIRDINQWVSENTNNMINDIADESISDLLACFMNAIAFEADWDEQYEADDIYEEEFTNCDKSNVNIDMLHSQEFGYIEDDNYTGFVKPYKGYDYYFMALLPKRKTRRFLVNSLNKIDFKKLFTERTPEEVMVAIPEFKYSCGGDITDLCKALGINQAFTPQADFSLMTSEWIKLDSIVHKAYVELDRKGTKAAAATLAYAVAGCAFNLMPKEVELTRPFLYAIVHSETGLPVFTGAVNSLDKE